MRQALQEWARSTVSGGVGGNGTEGDLEEDISCHQEEEQIISSPLLGVG